MRLSEKAIMDIGRCENNANNDALRGSASICESELNHVTLLSFNLDIYSRYNDQGIHCRVRQERIRYA